MNAERWRSVEECYHAALEQEQNSRAAFVRDQCEGDEELRREVESLLSDGASSSGDLVNHPPWEGAASSPGESSVPQLSAGAQLGPYRIETFLAAGGMGQVYRARDSRLGRAVAIKIASQKFGERFERETRAISAINHPHICTLYDVGPNYLVMELGRGRNARRAIAWREAASGSRVAIWRTDR